MNNGLMGNLYTGTKCSGSGCVLHDSHEEVFVRRGLQRTLWDEIKVLGKSIVSVEVKQSSLLEPVHKQPATKEVPTSNEKGSTFTV